MTNYVIITIDTEEDQWGDYGADRYSTENITRLPRLQKLFMRYGAVPTYLINHPVAASKKASRILTTMLNRGGCEIGTHCHPWNTPPYEEEKNAANSMMCNLDEALVYKKLEHLHQTIESRLDCTPISFRTGRWGFGPSVAKGIKRLGYKIDTSVTPFVDWTSDNGPDYSNAYTCAYRFNPDNPYMARPDGKLLEVPATIGFLQNNFRFYNRMLRWIGKYTSKRLHLMGILNRLRLVNFGWLSPELNTGDGMIRLARSFLRTGHSFLNMSFHSTSLLPGMSPFVRNEKDLDRFMRDIEIFLRFAAGNNMTFAPLSAAKDLRLDMERQQSRISGTCFTPTLRPWD